MAYQQLTAKGKKSLDFGKFHRFYLFWVTKNPVMFFYDIELIENGYIHLLVFWNLIKFTWWEETVIFLCLHKDLSQLCLFTATDSTVLYPNYRGWYHTTLLPHLKWSISHHKKHFMSLFVLKYIVVLWSHVYYIISTSFSKYIYHTVLLVTEASLCTSVFGALLFCFSLCLTSVHINTNSLRQS